MTRYLGLTVVLVALFSVLAVLVVEPVRMPRGDSAGVDLTRSQVVELAALLGATEERVSAALRPTERVESVDGRDPSSIKYAYRTERVPGAVLEVTYTRESGAAGEDQREAPVASAIEVLLEGGVQGVIDRDNKRRRGLLGNWESPRPPGLPGLLEQTEDVVISSLGLTEHRGSIGTIMHTSDAYRSRRLPNIVFFVEYLLQGKYVAASITLVRDPRTEISDAWFFPIDPNRRRPPSGPW